MNSYTVKKVTKASALLLAALLVFNAIFFILPYSHAAQARVTQAHIDRLREDRRNIQTRMQNVQAQIDAIEFDMLSETVKREVLEDRIILTGFEIENIVATIEEYIILINDKERQIDELLESEKAQMQLYRDRVRSMEEGGIITYLEILFDSTSFADLLARLDFVADIMRADERIYNDLVNTRLDTIAVRENLLQTKEAMEEEFALLESREDDLLKQMDELDEIIARLEADLSAADALHRQLSADDARIQQTINNRVEQLRRQQEQDRQRAAREANAINTWGSGSSSGTTSSGSSSSATDDDLRWLAFIIHLEANGESLQGRIAVGNVVMNRVRSPLFPNTIRDVILAPGQFPPAHTRNIDTFQVSSGSLDAARRVLNGERANGIGNALYFNRAGATSWASQNRPLIITIGNHDFFG